MYSGLFPGTARIASSSAEHDSFWACLKLHPPRPRVTLLLYFPVIQLILVQYLPFDACVYLHQLHFIQHGTYGQRGDQSLFTEESRSPT